MSVSREGAVAATGGQVTGVLPPRLMISIDSRTICAGETFLALRGERFDGHAHVREALSRGAAAVVLEDAAALPAEVPALVVSDTQRALQALAGAARSESQAHITGITGSTGKTTVKALLHQLVQATLDPRAIATPANENNEIGVAKTLLSLEPDTPFAIVEMGCRHYGDLVPLVAMARPGLGILSNIGDAHLEIMGSRARLIETKFALFSQGARPVLNALDPDSRAEAQRRGLDPVWFAAPENATVPDAPGPIAIVQSKTAFDLIDGPQTLHVSMACSLPGRHNRANLAAALAAAWLLGAQPAALAAAVPALALPAGRYERERIGDLDVIFDAYNASMSGTLATLDAFAAEHGTRRIAVLGSMAELGADASSMHRRVGAAAAGAGVDTVLVGGEYADDLAAGARDAGLPGDRVVHFARNHDAIEWLREHAGAGDVVLLKASRRYRLEEIVEGLRVS